VLNTPNLPTLSTDVSTPRTFGVISALSVNPRLCSMREAGVLIFFVVFGLLAIVWYNYLAYVEHAINVKCSTSSGLWDSRSSHVSLFVVVPIGRSAVTVKRERSRHLSHQSRPTMIRLERITIH